MTPTLRLPPNVIVNQAFVITGSGFGSRREVWLRIEDGGQVTSLTPGTVDGLGNLIGTWTVSFTGTVQVDAVAERHKHDVVLASAVTVAVM